MDSWWIFLLISLFISYALRYLLSITRSKNLPPGPPSIPIISTLFWLTKNTFDIEPILRDLRDKHGPILTLRLISTPSVFIFDRHLAHQTLIQKGAIFADRLPTTALNRITSSNRHNVSSAPYGPLWSVLRRNLSSEILHPTRVKKFAKARKWVVDELLDKLREQGGPNNIGVVAVRERFQFAMFCLLVFMCFGRKLDMDEITEIYAVQTSLHRNFFKFNVFTFCPNITKIVYRKRWELLLELRRKQEEIFIPLIRARGGDHDGDKGFSCSYTDSLQELSIPEEAGGRPLTEGEMVSLCSEFLGAGTDTTATSLEWIMAEIVKHKELQKKLSEEIERVVAMEEEIEEEDLTKLSYLKAVVMEGLRRHPPTHLVVPHAVTEDVKIGGYVIPKNASVNYMVAEMGMDERVWEEPEEFKPERFLKGGEGEEVDITGSREIKMMPFGAGRRICPGLGLAMLHLEYFVANMVREFEWDAVEGEEVELSDRLELSWVMKNHLRARITPRRAIKNMRVNSPV